MASNAGGGLSSPGRGQAACQAQREEKPPGCLGEFICSKEQGLLSHPVPVSVLGALSGLCSRHLQYGAWRTAPLITGVRAAPCMLGTLPYAGDITDSETKSLTFRSFQLVGVMGYPD